MSPPEIWGPPIWTFFHVMAEKIIDEKFNEVSPQIFMWMKRICHFLPCPECSMHASSFLGKIKPSDIDTKQKFIGMVYLFHNTVNVRKRKPLFNFANMNKYKNVNIIEAFKGFLKVYNTKGNMKLLTESFQRDIILRDIHKWMRFNLHFFFHSVDGLNDDNLSAPSEENSVATLPFDEKKLMVAFSQPENLNPYQMDYPLHKQFSMNLNKQTRFQLYPQNQTVPFDNYYLNQNLNNSYNYNFQNGNENAFDLGNNGIKYTYILKNETENVQSKEKNNSELVQFTENVNDKMTSGLMDENINFNITEKETHNNNQKNEVEIHADNIDKREPVSDILNNSGDDANNQICNDNISNLPNNVSEINIVSNVNIKKNILYVEKELKKTNEVNQMADNNNDNNKPISDNSLLTKDNKISTEETGKKELEKMNEIEQMIVKLSNDFEIVKKETENIQNVEAIVEKAVDKALEKALETAMSKVIEKTIDATIGKDNVSNSTNSKNDIHANDELKASNNKKKELQHVKKSKK